MRIDSVFHMFFAFMVVLTFSIPFVTLAQQNSVKMESTTSVAQDLRAIKAEAERDANNDVNKFLWFGKGAVIGSATG